MVLDSQAGQIRSQAVQESERLARDKNAALQLLQKEKEKLAMLERRYHSLTGGRPFPKTTPTLKEVTWLGQPQPHEPTGLLGGSGETGGTFAPGAEV